MAGCVEEMTNGKSDSQPAHPFSGRRHIVSVTEWDEDSINAEVQGFIEFLHGAVVSNYSRIGSFP